MRRTLIVLAGPAAAAMLFAGCGSESASPAAGSQHASATVAATPATAAAATGAVTVTSTEFAFAPMAITAKAGALKITLDNKGKVPHELVVLKSGQAAGSLPVKGGRVSEKASVGEVSETAGGTTKSTTLTLEPGRYVIVCNIPGHYQDGMRGTLTVQ